MKGNFAKSTKEHYTLREIERAIRYKSLMYSYAEKGDLEVVHLIVDAETAVKQAEPTDVQLKTVELVWRQNYSLVEAGRMLDVTPQAVKFNLELFKVKLQKVVDRWRYEAKIEQIKAES